MPVLANVVNKDFESVGVAHKSLEAVQEFFNMEFFGHLRRY